MTTHVSAATPAAAWNVTTQDLEIREQLDADAQALSLEVFRTPPLLSVCPGDCARGKVALDRILGQVEAYLTANTQRIVTLLVESHVRPEELTAAFEAAGLGGQLYRPPSDDPWPTLATLIDSGKRLVVFASAVLLDSSADGGQPEPDWPIPLDRWVRQTRDDATTPGAIDCEVTRGDPGSPFLLLHQHVPSDELLFPREDFIDVVNSNPVFLDRLETCRERHGSYPSFVQMSFFERGDAQITIQQINSGR